MKSVAIVAAIAAAPAAIPAIANAQNAPSTTATTTPNGVDLDLPAPETIVVLGERVNTGRVAGSAHRIDVKALTDFEYDDIQRVLTKIPGVYIRDEDGFGLRPNIGLRGANSDRSSRVVLMEDDVLLGPAPYAAPAAYFTPLTTRMEGVEVFKGPASIRYGPYTVGGAINLQTAGIPEGHAAVIDAAVGQFGYGKLHGRYGWGGTHAGFLIEGVRLSATGFKELDGEPSADTGFAKNEVMLKARLNSSPSSSIYHRLDIKLGYADELSNETYLGLTDADFAATPLRRYRGSQLARMEWDRTQAQISYGVVFGDNLQLKLVAYRHDFQRAWLKLNRFRTLSGASSSSRSVESVLTESNLLNDQLLSMVRGEVSSASIFSQDNVASLLGIGTNDRTFVSQGLQLSAEFELNGVDFSQRFRLGARLHYDEIKRRHDEAAYEMVVIGDQPGTVVRASPIEATLTNDESALAISLYLQDEMTIFSDLVLTPGVRTEIISTRSDRERADNPDQDTLTNDDVIFIPGIGAYLQATQWLGLLAGVHRGFSPVAPGQLESIEPETSWNYEGGLRFNFGSARGELIGFFSDYTNLLVTCTFSSGCEDDLIGVQFNAANVAVFGLEAAAHLEHSWHAVNLTFDASYTLTESRFRTAFRSGSPQFEEVDVDDRLPYVPIHQAHAAVGATVPVFGANAGIRLAYTFVDRMRNEASQGDVSDVELTDAQHVVDATLQADFTPQSRLYVRVDNLLNQTYIASRRPFGARPGKPFQLQVGFTYRFGQDY